MLTSQKKRRVLIADDDAMIRRLVSNLVEKENCTPVIVEDGGTAYRLLQNDAEFSCAIFDLKMPQLEGLDLLRFMRTEKRLQRIPVMLITSEHDLRKIANSFAAGAALFLPKPFSSEQFQTTFRLLLNSHTTAPQSIPSSQSSTNLPDVR